MKTPTFDFVGNVRRWTIISGTLLVISILVLGIRGLNLSIDFVGGNGFTLSGITEDVDAGALTDAALDAGAENVTAQVTTSGGEATGAIVRTASLEPGSDTEQAVERALLEVSGADEIGVTFVGPSWGQRISTKALQALVVFLVVVVLYISVRLDFKMSVAAVIALTHDILITMGVYSLVGFNVSPSTVIALLTILGYSLYDTVVVFDRVEETSGQLGEPGRRTYGEVVNTAMNDVLWRSINTSLTSLLPVGALLLIGSQLLGATTLADLALALFVGMALGTYSSLFVAGPFLAWWRMREPEHARRAAKLGEAIAAGAAPPKQSSHERVSRAPVTTQYVRGQGKRSRRKR